ncbi:sel1 repeat family protein [Streptomyces sp. S3(2020)]|uniref:tetratricopeptide repeat protein n=1 Tax=Streptomyces sp. S3(2020) TaxID=2732044 RepID=UPI0014891AD2|nr:sel1 repeat family protein [Streptomyces sp. S3(2020)]
MASELEQLRDDLLTIRNVPSVAARILELLDRSGVPGLVELWILQRGEETAPQARLASLEALRLDRPREFTELRILAEEYAPRREPTGTAPRVEAGGNRSVAARGDIGFAVTGDNATVGTTHVAGDHVDFRNGTFHDVIGVQHHHYGTVPAPGQWRPVAEVTPLEFGVRSTRHVPGLPDVPPYASRDCDDRLRATLVHPGLVLILGEPYAGRSYTAWQGVRLLEGRRLYALDPGENLRGVLAALRGQRGEYVVWLDDLSDHLGAGGMDPRLLGRLAALGAVVLGTMSPNDYYRRRSGTAPGDRVVAMARTVELAREWSEAELERLAAHDDPRAYPAYMWSGREGAASYFAVGHLLFDEWRRVGTRLEHPGGQSLVRAAVDLARCGVTGAVPAELLRRVQEQYVTEKRESFEEALAWATAPLFGVSGLLVAGEAEGTWRAYGALVAEALRTGDLEPVPDEVWWTLLDAAASEESLDHAALADAAHAALRSRIEAGDTQAAFDLAIRSRGETGEALLRRAADAGHTKAAAYLARLMLRHGDAEAAFPYLVTAADGGDSWSALRLGRMHRDRAERWLRTAAEAGVGAAAHELGDMLVGQGREDEAVRWYRTAVAAGHREVAASLGTLLYYWSQPEAEQWLRYATAWGDLRATNCLGALLDGKKDADRSETEFLYRRAAAGGDVSAPVNLGVVLEDDGRHEEALEWYLKGHERGAAGASRHIAKLLNRQGREAEAAEWFRTAAADPEGLPASFPPPPGGIATPPADTVTE